MNKVDVTLSITNGEFRTFGPYGPAYQVLKVGGPHEAVRVQVLETGEELDYPLEQVIKDPEAA